MLHVSHKYVISRKRKKKKKYVEILTKNLVPIKIFYQFFHQSVILEREWINFHLYTNGWSSYIGHKYSSQKGIGFFFRKIDFQLAPWLNILTGRLWLNYNMHLS